MLTIQIIGPESSAVVTIPDEHAPSFRSAITEIRNEVGARLSGAHSFDKEDALTRASSALGAFAGALNRVVTQEDRHYA